MQLGSDWRQLNITAQMLIFGAVLSRLALSMTIPFLTLFLIANSHFSVPEVGLIVGGAAIAGVFGGFVASLLTDRFGHYYPLLISLYVWVITFLLFTVGHFAYLFIIATLLNGVCRATYDPISQVLLADMTPPEQRYRVFSMRYVAANIGYAIGPLLGTWFGLTGNAGAFVFTACTFLAYAVLLHLVLHRTREKFISPRVNTSAKPKSSRSVLRVMSTDKALLLFIIGGILDRTAYGQFSTNLSIHLRDHIAHGLQLFAVTITVNAITVVLCQTPISRWAERLSLLRNITIGNMFYAVGLIGFAFSRDWTLAIMSTVIFTFGEILSSPAGTLFIDSIAPDDMRSVYYSAKNILNTGRFFGPWIGGILLTTLGSTTMLCIMAGVSLLSTWYYQLGIRHHNSRPQLNSNRDLGSKPM